MRKKHIVVKCYSTLSIANDDVWVHKFKNDPRESTWDDIWIYYWNKRKREKHAPCIISKSYILRQIELHKECEPPKIGTPILIGFDNRLVDEKYVQEWIEWNNDELDKYKEINDIVDQDGIFVETYDTMCIDIYTNYEYITRRVAEKVIADYYFQGKTNLKFSWKTTKTIVIPT